MFKCVRRVVNFNRKDNLATHKKTYDSVGFSCIISYVYLILNFSTSLSLIYLTGIWNVYIIPFKYFS